MGEEEEENAFATSGTVSAVWWGMLYAEDAAILYVAVAGRSTL